MTSGSTSTSKPTGVCFEIASFEENWLTPGTSSPKSVLSCGNENRVKHAYITTGNTLKISIPKRNKESLQGAFLLKYTGETASGSYIDNAGASASTFLVLNLFI